MNPSSTRAPTPLQRAFTAAALLLTLATLIATSAPRPIPQCTKPHSGDAARFRSAGDCGEAVELTATLAADSCALTLSSADAGLPLAGNSTDATTLATGGWVFDETLDGGFDDAGSPVSRQRFCNVEATDAGVLPFTCEVNAWHPCTPDAGCGGVDERSTCQGTLTRLP